MLIKSLELEVRLHTRCSVHFHPSPVTRHSFLIFLGSGSKTTPRQSMISNVKLYKPGSNFSSDTMQNLEHNHKGLIINSIVFTSTTGGTNC